MLKHICKNHHTDLLITRVFSRSGRNIKKFSIVNPPEICKIDLRYKNQDTQELKMKFGQTFGTKLTITYQQVPNELQRLHGVEPKSIEEIFNL